VVDKVTTEQLKEFKQKYPEKFEQLHKKACAEAEVVMQRCSLKKREQFEQMFGEELTELRKAVEFLSELLEDHGVKVSPELIKQGVRKHSTQARAEQS